MRHLLGALGGVLLALLLFTLLALLVAPPKDDRQVIEMPKSLSMIEAIDVQASEQASSPAKNTPSPPMKTPPPPPPAPLPNPLVESDIALPEPELPPLEQPQMLERMDLPELTEIQPTPKPDPQPEPQPEPDTQMPETPSPSESLAENNPQPSESPAATSAEAGSPEPTRRVPPEYPSRAQRRGLEGYVEVSFTIRSDGSVDAGTLRVIEAQPRNVFERAAMRAIARWQFPEADGLRKARQRLEFKLEG